LDLLELDIEDEVRVRGDGTREAASAVTVVSGDVEGGLLVKLHLGNTLIPALDDLANTNFDNEVAAADRGVELRALVIRLRGVLEPASVLHGDGLALGRAGAAALSDDGLLDSHCCLSEGEVARLGKERVDSSGDASSARDGCKRERAHLGKRRGAWSFIR
jgi:hypothetical protein